MAGKQEWRAGRPAFLFFLPIRQFANLLIFQNQTSQLDFHSLKGHLTSHISWNIKTINDMRNRINRKAICSSDNYKASKKAHFKMLEENHYTFLAKGEHFRTVEISGEVKFDIPKDDNTFVTVSVKGKLMRFTIEEHRILKLMKFI